MRLGGNGFDQCHLLMQVARSGGKLRNPGVSEIWIQTLSPSHLFVQAISFSEYHFSDLQNKHKGGGIFHPWEALNFFSLLLALGFCPFSPDAENLTSVHWC